MQALHLQILCFFVTGIITMTTMKASFSVTYFSKKHSQVQRFEAPIFYTLLMFVAESILMISAKKKTKKGKNSNNPFEYVLVTETEKKAQKKQKKKFIFYTTAASCCDLLASTISGIAMVYVDATIMQLLRGSTIVFVAIGEQMYRKKLNLPSKTKKQAMSLLLSILGLSFVGVASVYTNASGHTVVHASTTTQIVCIIASILGESLHAVQSIVEALLLKDVEYPTEKVVGAEGISGTLVTLVFLIPVAQIFKSSPIGEDSFETFDALSQSMVLKLLCLAFAMGVLFLNYLGLLIMCKLSPMHRVLLDALRAFFLFLTNVILHHFNPQYGEMICVYTIFELLGFVMLLTSTIAYNHYSNEAKKQEDDAALPLV
ncbi:hypothetical protein PCE1_004526 [Barthelona sp. PCE]